jgi:glycosyltransferase involved in cell wall biosynthesis
VDIDFFTPSTTPENGKFRVLFVGQPVRQKGLHYLLEAWTRLNLPKSELLVVARTDRDDAILRRYTGKFTLVGALGWGSLREEYRRADLLCLPSLSEGFGFVTLESLACGTPVLASDATGSSELLRDGEDGFVVPAANLASLMEALESAYSNRRLRDMRIAARSKAENFPWSRFRQSIRAVVEMGAAAKSINPSATAGRC